MGYEWELSLAESNLEYARKNKKSVEEIARLEKEYTQALDDKKWLEEEWLPERKKNE
jgi:hypothetical protein